MDDAQHFFNADTVLMEGEMVASDGNRASGRPSCTQEGCDRPVKTLQSGRCPRHYKPDTRFPPQALRPEEVKALLVAASEPGLVGARNRALISVLLGTGLRIAEALALRPHDLDLERGTVFVAHGKGDKSRTVGLRGPYREAVRYWLDVRRAEGYTTQQPVFCSRTGARLDTSYARKLLPRLAKKAGIERRVHPHALRHTFASEAARSRRRPELLQRQLGHSNLGTTTKYLSTISPDEVIEEFSK